MEKEGQGGENVRKVKNWSFGYFLPGRAGPEPNSLLLILGARLSYQAINSTSVSAKKVEINVGTSPFQQKGHNSGPAGDGRQNASQVRANRDLKLESGLNLHLGFKILIVSG